MGVRTFVNSCNCVLLVCLYYFKMPPTEQQTLPIGESTLKSIGDLKTLNKAIKFPVVSDTVKKATDVVTQISENAHVETARQYLQDGIKTLSETEAFTNIQGKVKELNENPRVQEVITNINLKDKVERLDTLAADGIESLASAVPSLRAPTPQLVETAKDTANSYLYLATEYLASFKSEEDPDYDPARDEDVEAEDEQADKELSEEETEVSEDEKEDNEVVV